MKYYFLFIGLCLCTCVPAQLNAQHHPPDSVWNEEDAARYARERMDSSLWNMERFAEDLKFSQDAEFAGGLTVPLYDLPSPVPDYDWGYVNMRVTELDLPGKTVLGATYAYAHDEYRPMPVGDTAAYYRVYFNILVLTDTLGDDTRALYINSRNAPHYLGSGKQLTSIGPIEFVQLSLASGENIALVNQRYFDLRHGRTILVAPMKDGSLRFMQLEQSPESLRAGADADSWNSEVIADFEARLEADPTVRKFFLQAGSLD